MTGRLAIARIAEDAIGLSSPLDLTVELIRSLSTDFKERASALRRNNDAIGLERLLLESAGGRPLVLVIENLDRVFAAIGLSGQHSLRALVESSRQVALLASTPLLFHGVASRSEPWFGSMDVRYLDDLTVEQGTTLLTRRARETGDAALADFLATPRAHGRLEAIAALAGGSPRLWHILSGCLSVEALDELIPAVRALLDELTPYYQQRLWELPRVEQRLVIELSRQSGATTVASLAEQTAATPATVASTLRRLAHSGWVRGSKQPGTDQRSTFYELREPLVRHFLQYREAAGGTLDLIVTVVRIWYSDGQKIRMYGAARLSGSLEKHLAAAVSEPYTLSGTARPRDLRYFRAGVRRWASLVDETDHVAGSPVLAAFLLAMADFAESEVDTGPELLYKAIREAGTGSYVLTPALRMQRMLDAASADDRWPGRDGAILALVAAIWDGGVYFTANLRQLEKSVEVGVYTPLTHLVNRVERANLEGILTGPSRACKLLEEIVGDFEANGRETHPEALRARVVLAEWTAESGQVENSERQFSAVHQQYVRVYGASHRETLMVQAQHAYWLAQLGQAGEGRDTLFNLLPKLEESWGSQNIEIFTARGFLAECVGLAGGSVLARNMFQELKADSRGHLEYNSYLSTWFSERLEHWGAVAADSAVTTTLAEMGLGERLAGQSELLSPSDLAHWMLVMVRANYDMKPLAVLPVNLMVESVVIALSGEEHLAARLVDALPNEVRDAFLLSSILAGVKVSTRSVLLNVAVRSKSEIVVNAALAIGGDYEALARLPSEIREMVARSTESSKVQQGDL